MTSQAKVLVVDVLNSSCGPQCAMDKTFHSSLALWLGAGSGARLPGRESTWFPGSAEPSPASVPGMGEPVTLGRDSLHSRLSHPFIFFHSFNKQPFSVDQTL